MATLLGGTWTLVVNNVNSGAQTVSVQLPGNGVSASGAYRTSASENLASTGLPTVSDGTATMNLPARSITTYLFRTGATTTGAPQ
jgi:O-glycosyl hydrolase